MNNKELIKEKSTKCSEEYKCAYMEWLEQQKCKKEPEYKFSICDYDPNKIYFMQYRPNPKKEQ